MDIEVDLELLFFVNTLLDQLGVIFSWSVAHEQLETGGVINDWSNHEMMENKIVRGSQATWEVLHAGIFLPSFGLSAC